MEDRWSKIYYDKKYIEHRRKSHFSRLVKIGFKQYDKKLIVLEACCGSGENLEILHNMGYENLYGIDLNKNIPENVFAKSEKVHYIAGDAKKIPFKDSKIDIIICMHSLHHLGLLDDVKEFMNESMRVLKKNGRIFIIDHYDSLWIRLAIWLLKNKVIYFPQHYVMLGKQIMEENEYLTSYIRSFEKIERIIFKSGFKRVLFKKDIFMFYYIGEKNGD